MKRVVLLSSTVAILVGAGLAAVIGKIALDHNPQDEFRACIKTVIGAPVECHYTSQWFGLLVIFFVIGFVPTMMIMAVVGRCKDGAPTPATDALLNPTAMG